MLNHEELFIKELEKDYILIDADTVRREYKSIKPREVDIILNNEYGSTQYLNMNLDEKEFEEILTNAEKNKYLFGIWRKSL